MAKLAMHFHDTYGQALANLYAGMEEGCRVINSAAGGLGGCPYAPGATGNVATEDVVYMLDGMAIRTGVDMGKLLAATNTISKLIGRPPVSRVASALNAKARSRYRPPSGPITRSGSQVDICGKKQEHQHRQHHQEDEGQRAPDHLAERECPVRRCG